MRVRLSRLSRRLSRQNSARSDKLTNREEIHLGIPASPGIIIGVTRSISRGNGLIIPEAITDPETEIEMFRKAIAYIKRVLQKTSALVLQKYGKDFARIFEAQAMIVDDAVWNQNIERRIRQELLCAEFIYNSEAQKVIKQLEESKDSYLRERLQDIQAVTARLISYMTGEKQSTLRGVEGPTIVVARYLSPADILAISFRKEIGFVTGVGGPTSHASLMAKSLGVPAVIGIGQIAESVSSGLPAIIDGHRGSLIINPTRETIKRYRDTQLSESRLLRQLNKLKQKPAITSDDVTIKVLANIELPGEAAKALASGAEGIGLYRTEYLFLTRTDFPTFNEQFQAYSEILRNMGKKPVVIRTFDLGGDKFPGIAGTYYESNPFLGWRAIRFCLDRPDIFKIQLKSLLKASPLGNLSILIPMISNFEEFIETKRLLDECKEELRNEKVKFARKVPLGVMLEVPSAAMIAEHLAREADFFSIGTNDLIQYTVAVDRDHEMLSKLYQSFHPAVLSLIKSSVKAAHKYHKKVSVCGEMAADPLGAILLVGLGVDELSAGCRSTGILKKTVRSITYSGARRIANKALELKTNNEVEDYLTGEVYRVFPEAVSMIEFSRRNSANHRPAPRA